MAGGEESRGEGKLHQSAVGDRNALDISCPDVGTFKASTFSPPILGRLCFHYFEGVFQRGAPVTAAASVQ